MNKYMNFEKQYVTIACAPRIVMFITSRIILNSIISTLNISTEMLHINYVMGYNYTIIFFNYIKIINIY